MAADIVALLEHEGIDKVHAVGHDFGSIFLSTIINYYPSRILSCTFLAVPYSPPGRMFDLDLAQQMTEKTIEFERFGYMRFFNEDDSWKLMNEHVS
jgi:soluble epoxide hydrolase/lipid-phosphate phosphatase